jgi:hypothetical protein
VHLERFAHFMQLWQPLDTQSKNCTGMGLLSLVQGGIYFSLGAMTTDGHVTSGASALILLVVLAVFTFFVLIVFESSAKFKFNFTKWCILVLFCGAPLAAWVATVAGAENPVVRTSLAPICALFQSLLFIVGYIQSFSEMRSPVEITQKYITGPNGQEFTDCSEKDLEKGGCGAGHDHHGRDIYDLGAIPPQERQKEEKQAKAVMDSVRRSVRGSLLLASAAWFVLFLDNVVDAVDILRGGVPMAADLEDIPVTWPSGSVFPHAFVYAGNEAFAANKFRVFRITFANGKATAEAVPCALDEAIADISAVCEGDGSCQPVVLLEGEGSRMVTCPGAGVQPTSARLLQSSSLGRPTRFALHLDTTSNAVRPTSGPLLALFGDSLVEYSHLEDSSEDWSPLSTRLQAQGAGVRSIDYDGKLLYLFERSAAGSGSAATSEVQVLDLDTRAPRGRWALPRRLQSLAAGSAEGAHSVLLLPEGPAPDLMRWRLPL